MSVTKTIKITISGLFGLDVNPIGKQDAQESIPHLSMWLKTLKSGFKGLYAVFLNPNIDYLVSC